MRILFTFLCMFVFIRSRDGYLVSPGYHIAGDDRNTIKGVPGVNIDQRYILIMVQKWLNGQDLSFLQFWTLVLDGGCQLQLSSSE